MVVSSGMQSMETMRRVYETVKEHNKNFCILQCTSAYPLEPEDVNLRIIMVKKPALYTLPKKLCISSTVHVYQNPIHHGWHFHSF